jgi:hypothetical protein
MAVNIWERVKKNVGTAAGAIRGARDYLKGSAQNRLRENVSKPSPSLASKPPAQYGPPAPKQPSGMAGGGGAWGGTSVLRASPVSTGTEPGRAAPTYKVPQAESSVAAAQRPGPEIWGSPEGYGRGPLNMKTDDGYTSDDPSVRMRIALMQRDAGGGGQTVSQAAGSAPTTASVPAGLQLGQLRASVSPEQARIDALRKGYLSTLGQSEEERTLAEELAAFRESAGLGITGLEGQGRGIPLGLVRGQQEKLESQAAVKEQSYLERLGLAQSARQMEQQRAQAALGYAEQDAAAQLAAGLSSSSTRRRASTRRYTSPRPRRRRRSRSPCRRARRSSTRRAT